MVKRFIIAALLAAACIPGRHPVEGTLCDLEHPCPDDLLCKTGADGLRHCFDDRAAGGGSAGGGTAGGSAGGSAAPCSAHNLLMGGDFEEGQFAMQWWLAMGPGQLTMQGATVHAGAYAARLSATSAGTAVLQSQLNSITPTPGSDHCAEAWVKAASSTGPITLQLVRWEAGPDPSGTPAEATVTADGTWHRVTNRFAYPTGPYALTVQVNAPLAAGADVYVDDVCVQVCP